MMTVTSPGIASLEEAVASLPPEEKALFERIYRVSTATGELLPPARMRPWITRQFGSVDTVTRQKIVKVTNLVTFEGALFNRLRASRPIEPREEKGIGPLEGSDSDQFADVRDGTPEDTFGRIAGRYCVTASNVAKCDGLHGLVIFNDFNPLHFSREQVIDYLDVAWKWAETARASHPGAKYFFLTWNCLWRSGASVNHGHAQVLLTTGRHYARIDGLRQAALGYRQSYGADYFSDLFQAHRAVGCAIARNGVSILAHLTPFKDNEVVLMADELGLSFKERIYEVLACFRDRMGITSFNLGLVTPPLAETEESWEGFPVIARVVDRGDLSNRASDVGGMEIYASSVISSDPLELARELRQYLD
ncbi:MAG: hypothetical protein U9O84_01670 [Chloroflexota bacterium]|nr:hypothetical protein [Chloroflexota bacterium]